MGLVEIRSGRNIWIEVHRTSSIDTLDRSKAVALLVHGSCARLEQVWLWLHLQCSHALPVCVHDAFAFCVLLLHMCSPASEYPRMIEILPHEIGISLS